MLKSIKGMILLIYFSIFVPIIMGVAVIFLRMKAAKKPVNSKKIILPPLFMSTGAIMFVIPYFRVTPLEILEALGAGILFSILLIMTTKFQVKNDEIYLKPSRAFPLILIGLLIFRIVLKLVLTATIDVGQLAGMFWILAFGMIVPWRIGMYVQYRKLRSQLDMGTIKAATTEAP